MLRHYLEEIDPEKTDVVVVAADVFRRRISLPVNTLSPEDQKLMTAVVPLAEKVGKPVLPLVIPTDNPFDALARVGHAIHARELVVGSSHRQTSGHLLDEVAASWNHPAHAQPGETPTPITIRVLGDGQDERRVLEAAAQS